MKVRSLLLSSMALAALSFVGIGAPINVQYNANYQSRADLTGGSVQPAGERATLPVADVERRRREAGWRRYARQYWDGKNRRPGDRAHKRMKHRRAASHHHG